MGGSQSAPKVGPINFSKGYRVSFIRDGILITGTVSGVVCNKYETNTNDPKTCNLNVSQIWIEDSQKKNIYLVNPNEPTLKIVTITLEEAHTYKKDHKVSFILDGIEVKGVILSTRISTSGNILKDESTLKVKLDDSILKVKLDDDKIVEIPFNQPGLKLVIAGSQKYTLEDENKYRVKYAKYKAKYLLQQQK